jgi:hypothetical protein
MSEVQDLNLKSAFVRVQVTNGRAKVRVPITEPSICVDCCHCRDNTKPEVIAEMTSDLRARPEGSRASRPS